MAIDLVILMGTVSDLTKIGLFLPTCGYDITLSLTSPCLKSLVMYVDTKKEVLIKRASWPRVFNE